MKATIVIPTVSRRQELERAVRGCLEQSAAGFEVLVVDNSSAGDQRWILDAQPDPRLHYRHELRPGLARARNAGVAGARGELIVFLDDDERPLGPDWLSAMLTTIESTRADAAFGPVLPKLQESPPRYGAFIEDLYTRDLEEEDGADISTKTHLLGSGNSCFRVSTCFSGSTEPFDTRYDATGGEDTDFIRRLALRGCRLVWASNARVEESVPVARMTMSDLSARRFAQGQMRSAVFARGPGRRFDRLLFWMSAGFAQYAYHSVSAFAARMRGASELSDLHRIKAMGGLGKVLWSGRFSRKRYG